MFENKKKFALWMYPDTLEKVGKIYQQDNCDSRSEFIEKAVNFYIGYLTSEDKDGYLPSVVTSTLGCCLRLPWSLPSCRMWWRLPTRSMRLH